MRRGLRNKMGKLHEEALVTFLGGRKTKASGSQWRDQMDGRHNRMSRRFAFAWDGKSTLAKSISVTREMWAKAKEQAGGERPMLALRWYGNERLDVAEDLVVLSLHDFVELLEVANEPEPPTRVFWSTGLDKRINSSWPVAVYPNGNVHVVQVEITCNNDYRYEISRSLEIEQEHLPGTWIKINGRVVNNVEVYIDGVIRYSNSAGPLLDRQLHFPPAEGE